jgi:hypothetical protein
VRRGATAQRGSPTVTNCKPVSQTTLDRCGSATAAVGFGSVHNGAMATETDWDPTQEIPPAEPSNSDDELLDWYLHPSLTPEERNPSLFVK